MQVHSNGIQYNSSKVLHFILSLYESFFLMVSFLKKLLTFFKFVKNILHPLFQNSGENIAHKWCEDN